MMGNWLEKWLSIKDDDDFDEMLFGTFSKADYDRHSLKLFERVSFRPGDSLLDLGCGNGEQARFLSEYGFVEAENYTGLDFNVGMIKKARKKVPKARFEVFDLSEVNKIGRVVPGKFDVVLVKNVLDYFKLNEVYGIMDKAFKKSKRLVVYGNLASPTAFKEIHGLPEFLSFLSRSVTYFNYDLFLSEFESAELFKEGNRFSVVGRVK